MARFDLTSLLATISFFVSVVLFREKILSFSEFCHFLLMVEGTIFLAGAISIHRVASQINFKIETAADIGAIKTTQLDPQVRFNPTRYLLGLIFFCLGNFLGKL